jgi:hypothetical protein
LHKLRLRHKHPRQLVARVREHKRRRIRRQQLSNLLPQISRQDSSHHRQVNPEQQASLEYQGRLRLQASLVRQAR